MTFGYAVAYGLCMSRISQNIGATKHVVGSDAIDTVALEARLRKHAENRLALSVDETAKFLGIARSTAFDAIKRGEISVIRIGRRMLVPVPALARMLIGRV